MTLPTDKQELINLLRKTVPAQIAADIISVQPMPPVNWDELAEAFAFLQAMSGHRCVMCRPIPGPTVNG